MRRALPLLLVLVLASTAHAADDPAPLTTHAFVISSITKAFGRGGDRIVGRLFGSPNDQFTIDVASVALERPVRARHKEAGFAVRAVAGTSVAPAKARGLDLGPDADLVQAVVQANLPVGAGDLKLMAGKMPTLLGVEGLDPTANPNVTVGSQDIYFEDYTGTGVDATWQGAGMLSASFRATNGWDLVTDNNKAITTFGRLGLAPDAHTAFNLFGYSGAERAGEGRDRRSGVQLLARRDHARGNVQLQLDLGHEKGIGARWWGVGAWATYAFADNTELALRFDRIDDSDGARTGGALGFSPGVRQMLNSYTATLNLKPMPGLLVRPEVRYDRSSESVFDGHSDQWTLGLSAGGVY